MQDYTTFASIATIARLKPEAQPRAEFREGELVKLHHGIFAGHKGRVLTERTGYFEIAVYNVGFGQVKTLLPARWLQRL